MLSEEALGLVAAILACGLLTLGVLELLAPTRQRFPRRPVARNASLQPRAAPAPAPKREERSRLVTPPPLAASFPLSQVPAAAEPSPSGEPPIERLLRSQAEALEPPRRLPPLPPSAPPSPSRPLPPPATPRTPPPAQPPPPSTMTPPRTPFEAAPSGLTPSHVHDDVIEAGSVVSAPRPPAPAAQPPSRPAMSASDRIYALWEGKQYGLVESEAPAPPPKGGPSAGETAPPPAPIRPPPPATTPVPAPPP